MVGSCGEFGQKHTAKMVNQKVSGSEFEISEQADQVGEPMALARVG